MRWFRALRQTAFARLLCLALAVWAFQPAPVHVPTPLETIQDHLRMVEEHGHSHGFEDDLRWAMHGHSHAVADHDHNPASLVAPTIAQARLATREPWRARNSDAPPGPPYLIERPPRA